MTVYTTLHRLLACLVLAVATASAAFAQSSGPLQPDFSTPGTGAGPSVNTFTGGFSFGLPVISIPGPDGSGYSMTLSYQSGTSPEQGASWVGYGWSLNAGAIVRDVRGYPDDWNDSVTIWNRTRKSWTASGQKRVGGEIASQDFDTTFPLVRLGAGYSKAISYNNYTGFRRDIGVTLDAKGLVDLNIATSDSGTSYRWQINPAAFVNIARLGGTHFDETEEILAYGAGATMAKAWNRFLNPDPFPTSAIGLRRMTGGASNLSYTWLVPMSPVTHSGIEAGMTGAYSWWEGVPNYRLRTLGYLYSGRADSVDRMDYAVDRPTTYRVGDLFLPYATSAADNYFVSGGGPVGSMRLYGRQIGEFRPELVVNQYSIFNRGLEIIAGLRIGFGGAIGVGSHSIASKSWPGAIGSTRPGFDTSMRDDAWFLRYGGDPGGSVLMAGNDAAEQAHITGLDTPWLTDGTFSSLNGGQRVGRTAYVAFNRNRDLLDTTSSGYRYRTHDDDAGAAAYLNRGDSALADGIGQITVTDGSGGHSVYGLPVYARGEKRLSFGVGRIAVDSGANLHGKQIIYAWQDTTTARTVIGEERNAPTAVAHLLTLITTPDYIDVTHDGPTPDDIGGYTKFNYRRTAGSASKADASASARWFHWRTPYNGLLYAGGDLSDPADDLGSFSMGEREQYYLWSIETKTHIAYFITNGEHDVVGGKDLGGSYTERMDAYQGPKPLWGFIGERDMVQAAGDSAASCAQWTPATGQRTAAPNPSRRLERIQLYTKGPSGNPDTLLATVHFEYDYSLRPGMPNSLTPHPDSADRLGMLTLRRVWSESRNVRNARVAPYEFAYDYRTSSEYSSEIRSKYPEIAGFADSLSAAEQNPEYSPFQLDRWGSYQLDGRARADSDRIWTNQHPDPHRFDPAAWQLKRIISPTGAELQVQYEQNDYAYVQDRPALAMVTLLRTFGDSSSTDGDAAGKYYLNLADLGVPDSDGVTFRRYAAMMNQRYTSAAAGVWSDRIYLKFLYALVGDTAHFDAPQYNSAYIAAHARASAVGVDSAMIGGVRRYGLYVKLGVGGYSVPKQVCHEFYKWNKRGRLSPNDPVADDGTGLSMIGELLSKAEESIFVPADHCRAIDYAHSMIRIPILAPKLGGGVRVRRLLSFDNTAPHDTVLYGTEYIYRQYDDGRREEISSGVATNEPATGREENALVTVDPAREHPRLVNKIIAGEDLAQFEGPLGESLLPGPSIGYARVVTRNIHTGKTNPGFGVAEFFTARDMPFGWYDTLSGVKAQHTTIRSAEEPDGTFDEVIAHGILGAVNAGLSKVGLGVSVEWRSLRMTQGYRFAINSMHGRAKSAASYGGRFEEPDSWALSSLTQYDYFKPGEKIPVAAKPGDSVKLADVGKECEILMDTRSLEDETSDLRANGDVSFDLTAAWTPRVTGKLAGSKRNLIVKTHVTTKVIRYPAYVKSVLTYGDGIYHMAESVAFDSTTGAPTITRTVDGFDRLTLERDASFHIGTYHAYAYPAANIYKQLGQKARNAGAVIRSEGGLTITKAFVSGAPRLTFGPVDAQTYQTVARLTRGDLLRLTHTSNGASAGFYHVDTIIGATVKLLPTSTTYAAADTGTGAVDVEVIESGYRNQIGGAVGSIVTYGETPAAVLVGANFHRHEPTDFAKRQRFADSLNKMLLAGGGLFYPAQADSIGAIFHTVIGGDDTCGVLADTLWLTFRPGKLVINRGKIDTSSNIVGSAGTPHALVPHLNHLLDTLWGFPIDTNATYASQCDSTTYHYRHYTALPTDYRHVMDSMMTLRFDDINFRQNIWIGDIANVSAPMDTLDAFQRTTNGAYSASGNIDLRGVILGHTIKYRLWVDSCAADGKVVRAKLRKILEGQTHPRDTTFTTHTPPTLTTINGYFPFTTKLGKFKQNGQGYLQYQDLTVSGGSAFTTIFGVRFIHGDTTVNHSACGAGDSLITSPAGPGAFFIDDDGRLYYQASDPNIPPQYPGCPLLCEATGRRYVTSDKVISAGAARLSDVVTYDTVGTAFPADANAYERGDRGRWHGLQSAVYRSAITGGAKTALNERVYAAAGVMPEFRPYNWGDLTLNDTTAWVGSGLPTLFAPNGAVLESRTPLGIYGASRLGYGRRLPTISAGNARYESIGFQSYEDTSTMTGVVTGVGHAGRRSLLLYPANARNAGLEFRLNNQLRAKGALLRFWAKSTAGAIDTATTTITVQFYSSISGNVDHVLADSDRVARSGEWELYSINVVGLPGSNGDLKSIVFYENGGGDTIYVDDVRIQPADAAAACYVFDDRTFRPVAAFDDDHFGSYPQYNAEGAAVRSIVETSRGMKTVAEAHGHLRGMARADVSLPITRLRDGGPPAISATRSRPRPAEAPETEGAGGSFDLLNVTVDPNGVRTKVLGVDPAKTMERIGEEGKKIEERGRKIEEGGKKIEKEGERAIDDAPNALVPADAPPELRALAEELKALNARAEELAEKLRATSDAAARARLEAEAQAVEARRREVVGKMGGEKREE